MVIPSSKSREASSIDWDILDCIPILHELTSLAVSAVVSDRTVTSVSIDLISTLPVVLARVAETLVYNCEQNKMPPECWETDDAFRRIQFFLKIFQAFSTVIIVFAVLYGCCQANCVSFRCMTKEITGRQSKCCSCEIS